MRGLLALLLGGVASAACGPARAASPERYHSTLQCRDFRAEADTVIYRPKSGVFEQSTSQSIRLVGENSQRPVHLDLKQHKSPDPLIERLQGIDGIASEWRCITSRTGRDFLLLYFFCSHEQATSCSTAMDIPGADWSQIYDARGRPLLKDPLRIWPSEQRRLRKLGLWDQFMTGTDMEHTNFIYPLTDNQDRSKSP